MKVNVHPIFLWPKQRKFVESKAFVTGFVGGRGTGKTTVAALYIALNSRDGDPWMAVSPTYTELEDSTWPVVESMYKRAGIWISAVKSPIRRVRFRTQDGGESSIVFRTGEKPESLRGPSKAGLWLDEPGTMNEEVYKIGLPVLRHRGQSGKLLMTFTPRGKRHWTYGKFYDRDEETGKDRLRPNRFLVQAATYENPFAPDDYYDNLRSDFTSALAEQELEGQFVDLAGLMFQRDWFDVVETVPRIGDRVRYWDKAGTEDNPKAAYTVGCLMSQSKDGYWYVEDLQRRQCSYLERENLILETAQRDAAKYKNEVIIVTEQEPGSGGKESAQRTIRMLAGYPAYKDVVGAGRQFRTEGASKLPGQAKIVRAQGLAAQAEAGNVRLKRGDWNKEFLDELAAFPMMAWMDIVDATSGAFNWLAKLYAAGSMALPSRSQGGTIDPSRHGVPLATNGESDRFDRPGWFQR